MKKLMLLCVVTIAISGCATTKSSAPSVACSAFSVIQPSRADTIGTKRQVLVHNETWRELCKK